MGRGLVEGAVISATAELFSYPARVVSRDTLETWPDVGHRLLDELSDKRPSLALVVGAQQQVDSLADRLSVDLGLDSVKLGATLARLDSPPTAADVEVAVVDAVILRDLEVLMWPTLALPILTYLRRRALTTPTIAVWPGDVADGRARFSRLGRPDSYETRLEQVTIIRPAATSFPDEVPYMIERIPA
jgi:hypothetical protein